MSIPELITLYCDLDTLIDPDGGQPDVDPNEIFDEFDGDNNDVLCADEIAIIYFVYLKDETSLSLDQLINEYDGNYDGCLCKSEFLDLFCGVTGICLEDDEEDPEEIFNAFDQDNDNKLS